MSEKAMMFEFVKKVEVEVKSYNGNMVKTGDVIELSGVFADKAKKNPDYKLVK